MDQNRQERLARALPAIAAVSALAYAAAAYFWLLSPLLSRLVPGGSLDLSSVRQDAESLREYAADLDAATTAYSKMNADSKDKVARMVPAEPAVQDLFVQLDAVAARNGLVLVSVDGAVDEKSSTATGRKSVRASANLAGGTYPQFKAFLSDLENAVRLTDVQSVVFSAGGGSYSLAFRAYFVPVK